VSVRTGHQTECRRGYRAHATSSGIRSLAVQPAGSHCPAVVFFFYKFISTNGECLSYNLSTGISIRVRHNIHSTLNAETHITQKFSNNLLCRISTTDCRYEKVGGRECHSTILPVGRKSAHSFCRYTWCVRNLRLQQLYRWGFRSSWMWRCLLTLRRHILWKRQGTLRLLSHRSVTGHSVAGDWRPLGLVQPSTRDTTRLGDSHYGRTLPCGWDIES
jgi:hypothetical protein